MLRQYLHVFSIFSYLLQKRFGAFKQYFGEIKYDKFIASFLIVLVITLPFYTANVYAVDPKLDVTVKNADDIEDFVKASDDMKVEVISYISASDDVEPDQVWLTDGGNQFRSFAAEGVSSCPLTSDGHKCAKTFSSLQFSQLTYPYAVCLYEEGDIPGDGTTTACDPRTLGDPADGDKQGAFLMGEGVLQLENIEPDVTSFTITEDKTRGPVTFNYVITDDANNPSVDTDGCSGIQKIEFYDRTGINDITLFSGTPLTTATDIATDANT